MSRKIDNNKFNTEELHQLAVKLISCKGLSGQEEDISELLKEVLLKYGFTAVNVDKYGNVTATLPGKNKELQPIIFDCHIDTVGVNAPNLWLTDPYNAIIKGNNIYGRGAADMRGALAALIYGIGQLYPYQPQRDIVVSGTVGEEIQEGMAFAKVLDRYSPKLVIICESTEGSLNTGQRGRAEIKLVVKGESAHTSNPQAGSSAAIGMIEWIKLIEDLPIKENEKLGKSINVLTDIMSKPYPGLSVLPEICFATYDKRLIGGEDKNSIILEIKNLVNYIEKEISCKFDVHIAEANLNCYTGAKLTSNKFAPAWYFHHQENFVQRAKKALTKVNIDIDYGIYSFCTNGSMSAGKRSIPTIGYGPCPEERAHINNEYIKISELEEAAKGYYSLAKYL